jgi:hypothetical protein
MWMVERRDRARLALEVLAEVGVGRKVCRQDFHCDVAAEARILRAVYFSHAARAEPTEDFVGT